MSQLKTVKLYGGLTQFSDEPMEFVANDFRDVVSGLQSRFDGFKAFLHEHPTFCVVLTGKDKAAPRALEPEFINTTFGDDVEEVHVFPDMRGSDPVSIAAFAAYIGTSVLVATIIVQVAISIAIGLVMSLLAPKPKTGDSAERPEERPSFLFNGPENVVEQGFQVPIVYGTHMTGSVVVSAGITVEQITIPSTITRVPSEPDAEPWQHSGEYQPFGPG